jgi:hypothetical protein
MPDADADLLVEIRERYDVASAGWQDIRKEGDKDLRYVSGDPWERNDRKQREDAHRPCISVDELNQYSNQAIADIRINPLGVKFTPVGQGADERGAQFYEDKAREIEYRSKAKVAYTTAYENCFQRSYGWVRLKTEWVNADDPNPFREQIVIEAFANPNQVTPDPDFLAPDASDMRYCFVESFWRYAEFAEKWPEASPHSFDGAFKGVAPNWVHADGVTVAEYWRVVTRERTLLALQEQDGGILPVFEDELSDRTAKLTVVKKRPVEVRRVESYLTNGIEILKRDRWPGDSIPIVSCLGKVLWQTDEGRARRTILSGTRLARDPQMLLAFYVTTEAEVVSMAPKFPYFAARGQLDKSAKELIAKSLHEPVAVIEYQANTEDAPGSVLGPPTRQPYDPPIEALEIGKESARRAIQAAMGISALPSEAQRINQKSGKALQQIEASQQKGSYHFSDAYQAMIAEVGRKIENLIDKIHDTAADEPVRRQDDSSTTVRVNDPTDRNSVSTRGHYQVTVSAGPSNESTRDAAESFLDVLGGNPQVFPLIAPELVRMKGLGPYGEEIADILETMRPPQVQALLAAKKQQGGAPDPGMLQKNLMQLHGQLQQAEAVMAQMKQALDTEQVKADNAVKLKQLDIDFQREKIERDSETKLAVAELGAKVDRLALFLEERARLGTEAHEVGMAAMGHTTAMAQQQQGHEQALEQGDQSHAQALAQQDQAGQQQQDLAAQQAASVLKETSGA